MQHFIREVYTESLDGFSDEELKTYEIYSREYQSKPILIENFELTKNKHGQIIFSFDTKNHKYLELSYNSSESIYLPDGTLSERMARMVRIETYEKIKDYEYDIMVPVSRMEIALLPESDEEQDDLWGILAVLPNKWGYCGSIIPYKDFYSKETLALT